MKEVITIPAEPVVVVMLAVLISTHSGMFVFMSMSRIPSDVWEYAIIVSGWFWWIHLLIRVVS